jgi:hypothetical protein
MRNSSDSEYVCTPCNLHSRNIEERQSLHLRARRLDLTIQTCPSKTLTPTMVSTFYIDSGNDFDSLQLQRGLA